MRSISLEKTFHPLQLGSKLLFMFTIYLSAQYSCTVFEKSSGVTPELIFCVTNQLLLYSQAVIPQKNFKSTRKKIIICC